MDTLGKREWFVVVMLLLVLGVGLVPALQHARRERRDGIRRDEVRNIKTALEMEFNKAEAYPLEFDAGVHTYIVTESDGQQALAWYVRAELENRTAEASGFDEEHNVYYRVVTESGATFFDVCGGTLTCGAPARQE